MLEYELSASSTQRGKRIAGTATLNTRGVAHRNPSTTIRLLGDQDRPSAQARKRRALITNRLQAITHVKPDNCGSALKGRPQFDAQI